MPAPTLIPTLQIKLKVKQLAHGPIVSDEISICHAPLCMKFSRQEYWSRLPFPSPGDLPNPGIKPGSPALQADSLPPESSGKPNICDVIKETIG